MDYYKNQSYYDILGVKENATINAIERAKDRLKFGGPDDRAPFSMWAKIDEAYNILSNPEKRREYDEKLAQNNNVSLDNDSAIDKQDVEKKQNNILLKNFMIDMINETDNTKSRISAPIGEQFFEDALPRLKKVGKQLVLSVPTAILATVTIIKKLNEKYTLEQAQPGKQITQVKTDESELIEEYRKKLDDKINKTLTEYHYNYDLIIDRVRYENYIELLKKRIELKENEVVQKGGLLKYKLQLTALRNQLKTFELSFEKVNNRIKENKKIQRLSRIYENLGEVNKKIEQLEQSPVKKIISLKKLQVRKNNLVNKRNLKVQKIKSNREYYAIFKDSILSAHATAENFVDNLFVPIEKIEEKNR